MIVGLIRDQECWWSKFCYCSLNWITGSTTGLSSNTLHHHDKPSRKWLDLITPMYHTHIQKPKRTYWQFDYEEVSPFPRLKSDVSPDSSGKNAACHQECRHIRMKKRKACLVTCWRCLDLVLRWGVWMTFSGCCRSHVGLQHVRAGARGLRPSGRRDY